MTNFNVGKQGYCPICGNIKNLNFFLSSVNSKHYNGHLPICTKCCNDLLTEYANDFNNHMAGFWCVCLQVGIPFLNKNYVEVKNYMDTNKVGKKTTFMELYLNSLRNKNIDGKNVKLTDMMLNDILIPDEEEEKSPISFKIKAMTIGQNEKIWGKLPYTSLTEKQEAYNYLNEIYENYTAEIDKSFLTTNLANRYRDLCKAELRKRKADESGEMTELKNAQDMLNKQLQLLGLNEFNKTTKDEREKFIDRICWMIEETEPAEEEDKSKYADIAGYEEIFNDWMRSQRNFLLNDRKYPDLPKEVDV